MAEEQTRKFDLPWGTLLPVLAVLAGVIAQFKPLVSTRPPAPSEKVMPVTAKQDVDARLWQDPIAVAQKQEALLDAEIKAGRIPQEPSARHDISTLADLLRERASKFPEHVLLLAVMIDAGPYSEQGESRLRARQAVLEGLSESGFLPRDGEHIGFVTASWPPPAANAPSPPNAPSPAIERALLLPWEECEATDDPKRVFPKDTKRIVVVWLPAVNFNPRPLRRFAALIDQLAAEDIRNKINVKLIGPANSTGLQNMVREVRWDLDRLRATMPKTLDGVSIISPRATASDLTLLSSRTSASEVPIAESVKELLEKSVTGLHFVRTIATDDTVLRELIAELARRRIAVVPQITPDGRAISKPAAHIVILSEWDTLYGRSLSATFASLASKQSVKDIIERPNERSALIHSYYYLRGIDGQLPGDLAKDNQRDSGQKNQPGQESVPIEATEGLNQSDYLRRLARKLKDDNSRWQRQDGFGIRAIGLLGSDIYDKLMILRALRPQFRDVVFFTNNYDAHFERRDDWDDTRNLIIASPFGGTLPENFEHRPVAPFRDNNQTSMYVGTLVATGRMEESVATDYLAWQPRVFEISRRGAYDLSPRWYLEGKNLSQSSKTWFWDWLRSDHVEGKLILGALFLVLMVVWVSVSIANRALPGGGTTAQRLKRVVSSTAFWLVCGTPVIVFAVTAFAQSKGAAQEPLAFFSGISIWPSEMLRLVAFMLAIHFMMKAGLDMRANERELADRFCLEPLPRARFRWRDLGVGLDLWRTTRPNEAGAEPEFSAQEAWHAYLRRNKFWPRFIRIGILFLLYFLFSVSVFSLFARPIVPARGEIAFQFDQAVLFLAVIGLMILSFYVVDAIQLNSNLIRMFAREVTKWGRGVAERCHRFPPLDEKELSAYHEIFFVAERTEVVARLIWYPLIVLTLMFLARCSFFDQWTWPLSLVLIFALNATWALGSAILLRRAAEQLREAAISNLQLLRVMIRTEEAKRETFDELTARKLEGKRETFDELIAEIRGLKKGAFAPLTEQPFIRAIIVPSGGLGLLAVGQRLLDIF